MRRSAIRRRRTIALLVPVIVVAVAVVLTQNGGSGPALYHPPGKSHTLAASVTGGSPSHGPGAVCHGTSPPQRGSSATVAAAAARLTLPQAVAELFVVELTNPLDATYAALGSIPWGGAVLARPGRTTAYGAAAFAVQAGALLRSAGDSTPLLGVSQPGGTGSVISGLGPPAPSTVMSAVQAHAAAAESARALRALGFNLTLAPPADVDVPQGALTGQLYSPNPRIVADLARAAVAGYGEQGVIAAVGHFPGEGAASADPNQQTATVGGTLAALRERDLIPFAAVARLAPVMVMSNAAYVAFDGVTPASLLPEAVAVLRSGCGFTGAVMSDDLDAALAATGQSAGQAALSALAAGDDLLLISGTADERAQAYGAVLAAAERSRKVAAEVQRAVLSVLALKATVNGATAAASNAAASNAAASNGTASNGTASNGAAAGERPAQG